MKDLQLYTASAGSGKTYQLALNYIRELFTDPFAYRHILAVTFTNKAAAEMKKRILEKLHQLSHQDEKASGYAAYLLSHGIAGSEDEIKQKADSLLRSILHDYSAFYVQTIDKFFQWIIRGFTKEIGLQNGYNLELDNSLVLSEAVDMLIFYADQDEQLRSWLIQFAEEKINEGKSWDFYSDVYTLGKEVFKENYQSIQNETENHEVRKEKFDALKRKLNITIHEFEYSIRNRGQEALKMISDAGLEVKDFKGGKNGVANLFTKAYEKDLASDFSISPTNRSGKDDFSAWIKKKDPNEQEIRNLHDKGLKSLLTEIIDTWDNKSSRYFTAISLKKNIYSFGILSDISDRIREITREKNLFLISDASMFLKKITGENEAPFIFEKAGNYFSNYMLDEFQDTSRFQWDNFLPLIENGLSTGKRSVVVGDVKQSIYRWRNSDWKILATELNEKISPDRIKRVSLDTNYRSAKNIVAFNNSVFHSAPDTIRDLIQSGLNKADIPDFEQYWLELISNIYGEPRQNFFKGLEGVNSYITHRFLRPDGKSAQLDYIREWLPELITDLQNRKYRAGDITILVRTGREGREIARMLMEYDNPDPEKHNFNVISNDSLYLARNSSVRFLSALLKFFNQPYDRINLSYIKHEYLSYLRHDSSSGVNWHRIFLFKEETGEINIEDELFESFERQIPLLRKLPLYELTEKLISIFRLNENSDRIAYVQAFQDVILEFIRKETSDISSFLSYWENASANATLSVSETQDAIRIMTIHKAKGLEFKAVIIPHCDWSLEPENKGNIRTALWPSTEDTDFNEFSHMPVMYGTQMKASLFKRDYYEELFRTYIDNLNLLYVAFTRAECELHSCSLMTDEKGTIKNVGDMVLKIFSRYEKANETEEYPSVNLRAEFDPDELFFSYGEPGPKSASDSEAAAISTRVLSAYPVEETDTKLALNHKNIYLSDLKEDELSFSGYGTQMHEIFSDIKEFGDIKTSVRKAWLKGLLNTEEKETLQKEISERLDKDPFNDWFSGKWLCKLEAEIIKADGEILRPDRVMIKDDRVIVLDYKFGSKKKEDYKEQMQEYCQVLKSAGYENVKMFLWYYKMNELVEVEP